MKCNEMNVIPQFSGTCWFNAILMSTLYSQNARRVLLKASKTWNKKDKLFKILKIILNRNYKNKLINSFFKTHKPEIILYNMLQKFNPDLKKAFKLRLINDITSFGFNTGFITKYLKYLNANYLEITYTSTNDIFINTDSNFYYNISNDNRLKYLFNYDNMLKEEC